MTKRSNWTVKRQLLLTRSVSWRREYHLQEWKPSQLWLQIMWFVDVYSQKDDLIATFRAMPCEEKEAFINEMTLGGEWYDGWGDWWGKAEVYIGSNYFCAQQWNDKSLFMRIVFVKKMLYACAQRAWRQEFSLLEALTLPLQCGIFSLVLFWKCAIV